MYTCVCMLCKNYIYKLNVIRKLKVTKIPLGHLAIKKRIDRAHQSACRQFQMIEAWPQSAQFDNE